MGPYSYSTITGLWKLMEEISHSFKQLAIVNLESVDKVVEVFRKVFAKKVI
jgi:hypothetical protein